MDEDAKAPAQIRVAPDRRTLSLGFSGGETRAYPAEMLRVLSPSAEVQGHSPSERKTVPGKRSIAIADVQPVGHYAIRVVFDDGHDTGIFSWRFLAALWREREARWQAYLDAVSQKGLSREA